MIARRMQERGCRGRSQKDLPTVKEEWDIVETSEGSAGKRKSVEGARE
jgi:hypothetical protein